MKKTYYYKGDAYVAFLDILGFKEYVMKTTLWTELLGLSQIFGYSLLGDGKKRKLNRKK